MTLCVFWKLRKKLALPQVQVDLPDTQLRLAGMRLGAIRVMSGTVVA